MSVTLTLATLFDLANDALLAGNVSRENAQSVCKALVAADADGLGSHGVSRIPFYADQAKSGKVDGHAVAEATQTSAACLRVDAKDGFAFPAIELGLQKALALAPSTGIVGVGVYNSHHSGAGGYHVERVATEGCIAIGFSNTPSAMAPWGGTRGTFGTNPIAFACPNGNEPPLVVDLSLSKVARGKVMMASQRGESIPPDWALDAQGHPTTDADTALAGTMLPIGDAKGAALALMVELLAAGLTGSNYAFEASSFFAAEGPPPRVGQFFIVIDPSAFSGADFAERVTALVREIDSQDGTRLPGARRVALREQAARDGVTIAAALADNLRSRAGAA